MRQGAAHLVGRHDFTTFRSTMCQAASPIKTLDRIEITADGSQELALSGGDFFRAVWVDEIVVNDIEVRPMGVHSLEFDAAGTARLTFVAIVPGRYVLSVPGARGESQQAVFTIR